MKQAGPDKAAVGKASKHWQDHYEQLSPHLRNGGVFFSANRAEELTRAL